MRPSPRVLFRSAIQNQRRYSSKFVEFEAGYNMANWQSVILVINENHGDISYYLVHRVLHHANLI